MTLTPEILDEFERLEKAATPAPWAAYLDDGPADGWVLCPQPLTRGDACVGRADQELAAEMRNHLPALIAAARELDRLKAQQNTCIVCLDCVHPLPPWTHCENCSATEAEDVYHHGYEGSEAEQRGARGERVAADGT